MAQAAEGPLPGGPRRRLLVLRHGQRPDAGPDPPLDPTGRWEAKQVAPYLWQEERQLPTGVAPITAIFSSPFRRALETAVPVSEALGLPIRVEYGFCELLAHGWLHNADPLPALRQRRAESLPGFQLLDLSYESVVVPTYPDARGLLQPGNGLQRRKPLARHRAAVDAALETAGGGSVLVVGHGATHDFVADALCHDQHPLKNHSGNGRCVPHCSITEIVEHEGRWILKAFGHTKWRAAKGITAPAWPPPEPAAPRAAVPGEELGAAVELEQGDAPSCLDSGVEARASSSQERAIAAEDRQGLPEAEPAISGSPPAAEAQPREEVAALRPRGPSRRALLPWRQAANVPARDPAEPAWASDETDARQCRARSSTDVHLEEAGAEAAASSSREAAGPAPRAGRGVGAGAGPGEELEALPEAGKSTSCLQTERGTSGRTAGSSWGRRVGRKGHSILHLLAMTPLSPFSHQAIIQLLEASAEVDERNAMGETPLILAVRVAADLADHPVNGGARRLAVVQRLLQSRADPEAADPASGETALMECADLGDLPLCRALLRAGACPLAASREGLTARAAAEQAGHEEVAELLCEAERKAKAEPASRAPAVSLAPRRMAWAEGRRRGSDALDHPPRVRTAV